MSDTEVQADTAEQEVANALATSEPAEAADPPADEVVDLEPDTFPRDYVEKLRKEAAAHRKERDTFAAQVEALQRQQVEQAIALSGVKPRALWSVAKLPDLLSEDGTTVDTAKVAAAIEVARVELGVQPVTKGNVVPGLGGPPIGSPKPENGFADAFKPHRSR